MTMPKLLAIWKEEQKTAAQKYRERSLREIETFSELGNAPDWLTAKRKHKAPEARHKCRQCSKLVDNGRRSQSIDIADPKRHFCTLRCAADFGVAFANYLERGSK